SILQRMRELSIQAANGTLETSDQESIQAEIDELTAEIDRIATTTQFNQKKLLNGEGTDDLDLTFQIGANTDETLKIAIEKVDSDSLKIKNITVVGTEAEPYKNASDAIEKYDDAINQVSQLRSKLGAYQNRLEYTVVNLQTANENLTSA